MASSPHKSGEKEKRKDLLQTSTFYKPKAETH